MKTRKLQFALLVLVACTTFSPAGDELPKPAGLVTDGANVLGAGELQALEARIQRLRESGVAEAIVYLAPALPEGAVLEDLTLRSVNAWGVGDAATNNGIAIFAFIADRKLRIEVGSGLEARISDAAAKNIIDKQLAPAFRAGQYGQGLTAAVDRIEALLRGDPAQYITTSLGQTRRIVGPANAPRVIRRVFPGFPDKARQARIQGLVHLEVLIDSSGRVVNATVTKGLPSGLSESAADAVRQWTFEPVLAEGKAVPALIDVVMNFKL